MAQTSSTPLLSRVKAWQFIGLGLSGWCTLYSIALLTFGSSGFLVGNIQGGCFATTMTLAGIEAHRVRRGNQTVVNPLQWAVGLTTERLNQIIAQVMRRQNFHMEKSLPMDAELGIGVRAVNSGRTVVFETARWEEPVIDLPHAESTEENRKKGLANLAVIVSRGMPTEDAKNFVRSRPLRFLCGEELKDMVVSENQPPETPPTKQA